MAEAGVATAEHAVLRDRDEALERLAGSSYPTVLKADGLAAGKGVIICADEAEARATVETFFVERRFGARVVLEEYLDGEELSLLALCDGENVLRSPRPGLQAHLRRRPGPNTEGMGSYSPVPGFDAERVEDITDAVRRASWGSCAPAAALPRSALRGPDADRRGRQGARVQLPLRRPGDAGRAAAAAR